MILIWLAKHVPGKSFFGCGVFEGTTVGVTRQLENYKTHRKTKLINHQPKLVE